MGGRQDQGRFPALACGGISVTCGVALTSAVVPARSAVRQRSGPRPSMPVHAVLGQVVALPADTSRLHPVANGEVGRGALVRLIHQQLLPRVAGPAERDEVVEVMRATVPGGALVVDLWAVAAAAKHASVSVPIKGEAPLTSPCADVGRHAATTPEDGLLPALDGGLASRIAGARADDLSIAGVAGELGAAHPAWLGDLPGASPSGDAVALGGASPIGGRTSADLACHAVIISREAEYADWAEDRIADGRPLWAAQ